MKSENYSLKVGIGRVDITPPGNSSLAGFGARDHAGEGVHDPLTATAMVLSQGEKTAVILALDLIGMTLDFVERLHQHMKKQFGFEPKQVMVNFSHTHAGPLIESRTYAVDRDGNPLKPVDPYVDSLIPAFAKAIQTGLDDLKPAKAYYGIGETNIGVCRRAPDEVYEGSFEYANEDKGEYGILANYPNPDREIDRTVPVIRFMDVMDQPIALLFGAPCHPTTLNFSNYLVSAEYPAVTRRLLEADMNGEPAIFLQGMGGDIKPRQVAGEKRFRAGTFEDVEIVGAELAQDVRRVIDKGLKLLPIDLKYGFKRVQVPLKKFDREVYERFKQEDQPQHRQNTAQFWLDQMDAGEKLPASQDLNLSILQLSPEFRFTGVSGELLTFMGWKIKENLGKEATFPLGYTDGAVAYIPDSSVIRVGGYEVLESALLGRTRPAPFSEEIDRVLLNGYDAIMSEMSEV